MDLNKNKNEFTKHGLRTILFAHWLIQVAILHLSRRQQFGHAKKKELSPLSVQIDVPLRKWSNVNDHQMALRNNFSLPPTADQQHDPLLNATQILITEQTDQLD